MTVIVSCITKNLIVMTADSAITTYFQGGERKYDNRSKSFRFPGVGCITTWGEAIHNKIGKFLSEQKISRETHSVEDLVEITRHYLYEVYNPKKDHLEEVGYHIGGFDSSGRPRLYHVFWGFDRPIPPTQEYPDYKTCDHSDSWFVYNGRNDLAHTVIQKLLEQLEMEVQVRYDVSTLNGVALFCDLIVRFAAELTPEVGPPFLTCLIFPDNSIQEIRNDTFSPLSNKLKEYHLEIPLNKYTPAKAEHEATALVLPSGIDMSQKRHTPPYSGGTITP